MMFNFTFRFAFLSIAIVVSVLLPAPISAVLGQADAQDSE